MRPVARLLTDANSRVSESSVSLVTLTADTRDSANSVLAVSSAWERLSVAMSKDHGALGVRRT